MNTSKNIFLLVTFLLVLWTIIVSALLVNANREFNYKCGYHILAAAESTSLESARWEMGMVINYLERNGDTTGFTGYKKNPNHDIGLWYTILKDANDELRKVSIYATNEEKEIALDKLKYTLYNNNVVAPKIICPIGMPYYPYNTLYMIMYWSCILSWVIILIWAIFNKKTNKES